MATNFLARESGFSKYSEKSKNEKTDWVKRSMEYNSINSANKLVSVIKSSSKKQK